MTRIEVELLAKAIRSQVDTFNDRRLNGGVDVLYANEIALRCAVAATANAICVALRLDAATFAQACGLYVSCRPGELTWEAPSAAEKERVS